MSKEENQELEEFIQDWHWDEKSHKFAQDFGLYLFQFIDYLYELRTFRQDHATAYG